MASLPRRMLSPTELERRRALGLCYRYDEKFVAGHRCKRLFVIEIQLDLDIDDNDHLDDSELEISLAALTGIQPWSGQTMWTRVEIGSSSLVALLDSGSTHNFIAEEVIAASCVTIRPRFGLSVMVANGDCVISVGLCRAMTIRIDHEEFTLDCYAMPLNGFDVILGVQWLGTLGPITWDFSNMTMSFARQGQHVTWTGLPTLPHSSHALACTGTNLLDDISDLFVEPHGLPPVREIAHRIHLKKGTDAIVVLLYRYAQLQKDELEC